MIRKPEQEKVFSWLIPAITCIPLFTYFIYYYHGLGDSGDSITHYLFARYAPAHPELYFDHWAKPLFVLLASPFAQMGMVGMKIFNCLCALATMFFSFRVAEKLKLKDSILAPAFIILSPFYFVNLYSGLTEPLFALLLTASVFYCFSEKENIASVCISFLPFIRSEGLIFLFVFGFYFLIKRKWKAIPLLATGHFIYSIAGSFVHGTPLWVFTKNPYATLSTPYGSGTIFHYVKMIPGIVGLPLSILFFAGILLLLMQSFSRKFLSDINLLLFLPILAFIAAHTVFWYFGIFNSMGLKRVMICIVPLMSLICLYAFNEIRSILSNQSKKLAGIFSILYMLLIFVFPVSGNPAGIKIERDFHEKPEQILADKVSAKVLNKFGNNHRFLISHPYLSIPLGIDFFNFTKRTEINIPNLQDLRPGDIVIWDSWFSGFEVNIPQKTLDENPKLEFAFSEKETTPSREIVYRVYLFKQR